MQLLALNFLLYTYSGIWRPIEWSSSVSKLLYNIFTTFVISIIYFLVLTGFMDIAIVVDNVNDFTANCLMFMSIVAVCFKATTVIIRRTAIINLVEILLKEPCKPRNEEESAIQKKFDEFIRSCTIKYSVLCAFSVGSVTIRSIINMTQGILPYRVWLPYGFLNISLIFWIVSIQQTISVIFCTVINVGTETLIFGFFLHTCAQFEIFECRLRNLVINKTARHEKECSNSSLDTEDTIISQYVRHHLCIYKYARTVNNVFNQILFIQFFGSILTLCSTVYYLSIHFKESETLGLAVYTMCMFIQIYIYCWSGNEIMLKSINVGNAVYHANWLLLSVKERKDLLMIMKRSVIPIKITSSFLVTLNLQSYANILKASYSTFNLLQRS